MASRAPTPKEVRKARAWLRKKGLTSKDVPPRKFAASAKELGLGFAELLEFIGILQLGGQGQAAQRQKIVRREAAK